MKFHPILFSTEMVSAILRGDKTMTRRVMKIQPDNEAYFEVKYVNEGVLFDYNRGIEGCEVVRCPFGKVGDVLWVRETWASIGVREMTEYGFKAGATKENLEAMKFYGLKYKPSIHMPKAACRLFLEITSIRAERLQHIPEQDAKAEGVEFVQHHTNRADIFKDYMYYSRRSLRSGLRARSRTGFFVTAKASFESLWYSINGEQSWDNNPWVWVIEFKRIEKPSNFLEQ